MECKFFVCAQTVVADIATRRVSLINILENVRANAYPIAIPCMSYALIYKEEGDDDNPECFVEIRLNDAPILKKPITVNFSEKIFSKNIVNLGTLLIPAAGNISVILLHEANPIANFNFEAKLIETTATAAPQP